MKHRDLPRSIDAGVVENEGEAIHGLVCPLCGAALRRESDSLGCRDCRRHWPVVDGIPHFIDDFPYRGEITREQMLEVNRRAAAGPWKPALLGCQEPRVQKAAEMILNLERANWQWLLDLPPESRVLDVGAGCGTNSHALAMHFAEVVALEPVLERVEFMRHRFTQEGLSNVRIVRSSLGTLPFAPESFDLVAMNGVLEWVPEGHSGDLGELHASVLKRMYGLLRPGGMMYMGIDYRACPESCLGSRDPQGGLPLKTLLLRRFGQWYPRMPGRDRYTNYPYSSRGYRRILRKVGFSGVDLYVAVPSYNHPRYLIPMKDNIFAYVSRNLDPLRSSRVRGIAHEVLLRLGLLKYMEDSFVILARK